LVIEAQNGNGRALEALLRRQLHLVNALAAALVGRDSERDDLVQECLLQVVRSIDQLREPRAFHSWLSAILGRSAVKMFRDRLRRSRYLDRAVTEDALENLPARMNSLEMSANLNALRGALDFLDAESRDALLLRRVEGFTLDEIADRMSLSLATVKRRLLGAKAFLDALERRGPYLP
jgi:RNA polymerase sigma-70 factor (ECF subfamily)